MRQVKIKIDSPQGDDYHDCCYNRGQPAIDRKEFHRREMIILLIITLSAIAHIFSFFYDAP
jgi:hypothetical protein